MNLDHLKIPALIAEIESEKMKDFNADAAREVVKSLESEELRNILIEIKKQAIKGGRIHHVYGPLDRATIGELKHKGFVIEEHSSIEIQRDSLYYSITW